jgi:hypothetical protein
VIFHTAPELKEPAALYLKARLKKTVYFVATNS